ncbi:MAG: hypothetical protein ACLP22_05550 [Solirubrobacteraceae bacterium]
MPAQSVQLTRVDATALISCARRTHRLSDALGACLVSELGVLRRAQTATDDPPAVVAFAQRAVTAHLPGAIPRAGVVVRSLVRRLAVATNGYRLFIAPVRLRSSGKIDVAALVLTNAHDRPLGVFPALSVTPESIAQGAQYATYGFSLHSSLLAQVVPDRVASVQFDFLARPHPGSRPQARITVTVHDNVAVAMQTPPLVDAWPQEVIQRDSTHATVSVAPAPSTATGRELNPASICTGIPRVHLTNPTGPAAPNAISRHSYPLRFRLASPTRQSICSQDGPPLRACRQADGVIELLYPDETLMLVAANGNAIGSISHLGAGETFPVTIPPTLAPAPYLTP